MTYDFHPAAQQELEAALAYYDAISPDLGDAFLTEVEQTIERIIGFPDAWATLSANTRRCRVSGFPYGIIYQKKEPNILIVAVMHLQRQPDYWVERI